MLSTDVITSTLDPLQQVKVEIFIDVLGPDWLKLAEYAGVESAS